MWSIRVLALALLALAQGTVQEQEGDALLPASLSSGEAGAVVHLRALVQGAGAPGLAQSGALRSVQLGALVRGGGGVEVDPAANAVRVPPEGADIEGSGPLRFEEGGRRLVLGDGVRLELDGRALLERRVLKPGERLVVIGPDGERRFRIAARGAPQGLLGATEGLAVASLGEHGLGTLQSHGEDGGLFWLRLEGEEQDRGHEGRFEVDAQDRAGRFRIVVVDGEVAELAVDGEPVDGERIVRRGRRVVVRGQEGESALELDLGPEGGATWHARSAPRGYAGVVLAPLGGALEAQLGLGRDDAVLVTDVVEDGPAAQAGLESFDVILSVAGERGVSRDELSRTLRDARPGEELELVVLRQGAERPLSVRLGTAPQTPPSSPPTDAEHVRHIAEVVRGIQRSEGFLGRLTQAAPAAPEDHARRLERLLDQLEALERRLGELERRLGQDPGPSQRR